MRSLPILLATVLAACASVPARPPVENPTAVWQARRERLARVDAWDVRGRLALRADDEGANVSLRWVRDHDRHRMNLAGPFGGGRVRLTYDANGAELRDANGDVRRGASVEQLLARATGWRLPLDGLNYWVLGLPDPAAPAQTTLDEWGRLKTLEQLGWDIDFLEYTQSGEYELPQLVFIRRRADRAYDGTVEARLVIENWALSSSHLP